MRAMSNRSLAVRPSDTSDRARPRGLIVKFGTSTQPWWLSDGADTALACELDYYLIPVVGGRPATVHAAGGAAKATGVCMMGGKRGIATSSRLRAMADIPLGRTATLLLRCTLGMPCCSSSCGRGFRDSSRRW